jgi:hypothetical protein
MGGRWHGGSGVWLWHCCTPRVIKPASSKVDRFQQLKIAFSNLNRHVIRRNDVLPAMSRNRTLHCNRWLYLSSYNLIAYPPVFSACRELNGPGRRVTIPRHLTFHRTWPFRHMHAESADKES